MTGGLKKSEAPSFAQTCAAIDAALYAFCAARWFNRSITIHFAKGGVRLPVAHEALTDFLKHAGDWLNKRGFGPAYYVYVWENPPPRGDHDHGGEHVHVLMHIPYDLWGDFQPAKIGWIRNGLPKLGGTYRSGVLVDNDVFYFRDFRNDVAPLSDYLNDGLRFSLLYLLKGFGEGVFPLLGIELEEAKRLPPRRRPSPQGCVIGKRVGFSESLSRRRHLFPGTQLRSGAWMAGREARARAVLREFGLQFTSAAARGSPCGAR